MNNLDKAPRCIILFPWISLDLMNTCCTTSHIHQLEFILNLSWCSLAILNPTVNWESAVNLTTCLWALMILEWSEIYLVSSNSFELPFYLWIAYYGCNSGQQILEWLGSKSEPLSTTNIILKISYADYRSNARNINIENEMVKKLRLARL